MRFVAACDLGIDGVVSKFSDVATITVTDDTCDADVVQLLQAAYKHAGAIITECKFLNL